MSIKDQIHSSHVLSVLVALGIVLVAGGCSSSKAIPTPGSSDVSYRLPAITNIHTNSYCASRSNYLKKASNESVDSKATLGRFNCRGRQGY